MKVDRAHAEGGAEAKLATEREAPPAEVPAGIGTILELYAAPRSASFASGRTVMLEDDESDRLVVRSPTGVVELAIRFGADGPVLSFASASLDLSTSGPLRVDCAKLTVQARDGIEVQTGGSVKGDVHGDHEVVVSGASRIEADSVAVSARLGDVAIKANDDVRLNGERIFLND